MAHGFLHGVYHIINLPCEDMSSAHGGGCAGRAPALSLFHRVLTALCHCPTTGSAQPAATAPAHPSVSDCCKNELSALPSVTTSEVIWLIL